MCVCVSACLRVCVLCCLFVCSFDCSVVPLSSLFGCRCCLSVCFVDYLCVCLLACLFAWLIACPLACLFLRSFVCLVCECVYVCVCVCVDCCLFVCSCVCMFVCLFVRLVGWLVWFGLLGFDCWFIIVCMFACLLVSGACLFASLVVHAFHCVIKQLTSCINWYLVGWLVKHLVRLSLFIVVCSIGCLGLGVICYCASYEFV